jgi:hypothetical protein
LQRAFKRITRAKDIAIIAAKSILFTGLNDEAGAACDDMIREALSRSFVNMKSARVKMTTRLVRAGCFAIRHAGSTERMYPALRHSRLSDWTTPQAAKNRYVFDRDTILPTASKRTRTYNSVNIGLRWSKGSAKHATNVSAKIGRIPSPNQTASIPLLTPG